MDIRTRAIKLEKGMKIVYPVWGDREEALHLPKKPTPNTYNIVGSRITFVDENGDVYAIPALKGIEVALILEGYTMDINLTVFFASGEAYPASKKEEWNALLNEMRSN